MPLLIANAGMCLIVQTIKYEANLNTCFQITEKFNVRQQMRSALLKLIENRPEDPLLFLANYFDSSFTEHKSEKVKLMFIAGLSGIGDVPSINY